MRAVERPTTAALVLGSGGARGYAHIGAIQVLAERGIDVVAISGSSMGALVGGLYAAGKLDVYTEWVLGMTQLDVVRLLDFSLSAPGAIRGAKIVARVGDLLDGARIEDLPIPYTAVATDLDNGREVWFQRGPVDAAIRASIAIPGFITPVMLNGRLLADGGILNPVPIAPTASATAEVTIAISLAGDTAVAMGAAPEVETAEPGPVDEWIDRFRRSAAGLLDHDAVRSLTARFGGARRDDSDSDDPEDDRPDDVGDREADRDLDALADAPGTNEDDREPEPAEPLPAGLGQVRHHEPVARGHAERAQPLPDGRLPARRPGVGAPRRLPQPRLPPGRRDDRARTPAHHRGPRPRRPRPHRTATGRLDRRHRRCRRSRQDLTTSHPALRTSPTPTRTPPPAERRAGTRADSRTSRTSRTSLRDRAAGRAVAAEDVGDRGEPPRPQQRGRDGRAVAAGAVDDGGPAGSS